MKESLKEVEAEINLAKNQIEKIRKDLHFLYQKKLTLKTGFEIGDIILIEFIRKGKASKTAQITSNDDTWWKYKEFKKDGSLGSVEHWLYDSDKASKVV